MGTSGWAYTSWKPGFYPKEIPAKDFLIYFSSRLNSVEVNYTFRTLLKAETAQKWIAATPQNFCFSFKMHQGITHFRRLKDVDELMERFLGSLSPFREAQKLGVVLIQLPHNMKSDGELLQAFLARLPKDIRFAVEFRHPSWLDESIYRVLRSANVALCVTEGTDELSTPDIQAADFSYYRLRRTPYSPEQIKQIAAGFRESVQSSTFCYFKHEDTPEGALNGVNLLKVLGESNW